MSCKRLYKRWFSKEKIGYEEATNLADGIMSVMDGLNPFESEWFYLLLYGTPDDREKLENELHKRGVVIKNRRPRGFVDEDE